MLGRICAAALALVAAPLGAQIVTATLPDYNSPIAVAGFPINRGVVGTFTFVVPPGTTVGSAYLEGTYGTSGVSGYAFSTASFNAAIDGTSINVCALMASCYTPNGDALRPFSLLVPETAYLSLLDGMATLGIVQTSGNNVRFGTPTLRIVFVGGAVPEPATWVMMLVGFGAVGFRLRRRSSGFQNGTIFHARHVARRLTTS